MKTLGKIQSICPWNDRTFYWSSKKKNGETKAKTILIYSKILTRDEDTFANVNPKDIFMVYLGDDLGDELPKNTDTCS